MHTTRELIARNLRIIVDTLSYRAVLKIDNGLIKGEELDVFFFVSR